MSVQFLALPLKDFLREVKGAEKEGRVDKALAMLARGEVDTPDELIGAKVATVIVSGGDGAVSAGAPVTFVIVAHFVPAPLF